MKIILSNDIDLSTQFAMDEVLSVNQLKVITEFTSTQKYGIFCVLSIIFGWCF